MVLRLVVAVALLGGLLVGVGVASAHVAPPQPPDPTVELADEEISHGDSLAVTVTLENREWESTEATVTVDVAGQVVENTTVTVPERSSATVSVETTPPEGVQNVTATVTDERGTDTDRTIAYVGDVEVDALSFDPAPSVAAADDRFVSELEATYGTGASRSDVLEDVPVTIDGEPTERIDQYDGDPPSEPFLIGRILGIHAGEYTDGDPTSITMEASYRGQTATHELSFVDPETATLEVDPAPPVAGEPSAVTASVVGPDGERIELPESALRVPANRTLVAAEPGPILLESSYHGIEVIEEIEAVSPTAELEIDAPGSLPPDETAGIAVEATDRDDETNEITHAATITIENESVLGVEDGQLVGLEPGKTTITAEYEWQTATATVTVEPADGLPGPPVALVALTVGIGVLAVRRWG